MKNRLVIHRFKIIVAILAFCCTVAFLSVTYSSETTKVIQVVAEDSPTEFLVDTPGCKIPSLNPWHPSIEPFYKFSGPYQACKGGPSFLRVNPNAVVSLDDTILQLYYELNPKDIFCTYQVISRYGSVSDFSIDNEFQLGPIKVLPFDIPLQENYIKTECVVNKNIETSRRRFVEYLALTPLKKQVEDRCSTARSNARRKTNLPNIIFLGIDSISRLNFIRHFPETNKYLTDFLSPISLKGYNKVGDNTFPNLVPLLTGHYYEHYWNEVANKTMYFDDVEFLWKEFAKLGYRTLLAEDSPEIATFNYYRSGFKKPPTDYYLRPFSLAVEHAEERYKHCIGNKMEMTVVYDYFKSFLETMDYTRPYFAFVFVARLTHDVFNNAGYADRPTLQLLRYLHESNHLNNTILIFYSDHGIRFTDVRFTPIGQFEERRPFMHLMFPKWFQKKYPGFYKHLKTNERRLTTPFDIHATILHLLDIGKETESSDGTADDGTIGLSLFKEVPPYRTCAHATISPHWCTCQIRHSVPTDDKYVLKASVKIIDTINKWVGKLGEKCSSLTLLKIHDARVTQAFTTPSSSVNFSNHTTHLEYLVIISALPSHGLFEATVHCEVESESCRVVDEISRINRYYNQSNCTTDTFLQKFCYCI